MSSTAYYDGYHMSERLSLRVQVWPQVANSFVSPMLLYNYYECLLACLTMRAILSWLRMQCARLVDLIGRMAGSRVGDELTGFGAVFSQWPPRAVRALLAE
jgi:hypothetical protein